MQGRMLLVGLLAMLFVAVSGVVSAAVEGPGSLVRFDPSSVTSMTLTQVKEGGVSSQVYTKQGGNWVVGGKPAKGVDAFLSFLSIMGVEKMAGNGEFGFEQAGAWGVILQFEDGTGTTVEFGRKFEDKKDWFTIIDFYTRTGRGPVMLVGEFDMTKLQQLKQAIK